MFQVVAGAARIGPDPGHGARDPDDGIVGIRGQQRLELALRLGRAAEPREGLAAGGQHGHLVAAQLDGPGEVGQRRFELVQLELDQGPVDEGLGEIRVRSGGRGRRRRGRSRGSRRGPAPGRG